MRTRRFIDVFNRVIRLLGRDPLSEVDQNVSRPVIEHINERVRFVCQSWRWPEWELTEERAFRQVWNPNHQYLRVSAQGKPDEVFYIPTTSYYTVNIGAAGDPPIGTLPTDPAYFTHLDKINTYVAYDQTCKRAIGMVLSVFPLNPSCGSNGSGLRFHPSERGIDVCNPSGPTVFITYKMPVPEYTIVPYAVGKTYEKGEVRLDPTIGEVFQALAPNTALPSDSNYWRRVPFLDQWLGYVSHGAFANCMTEYTQGGADEIQANVALAQLSEDRALNYLQGEVDALGTQGQKLQYTTCRRSGFWCDSQPWGGGSVTTLTDVCDDELGWIYPTPMPIPSVVWQYRPDIIALRAVSATPALDEIATRSLMSTSVVEIIIFPLGETIRSRQTWELIDGPANPADPNGEVAPLDYDNVNNDKHWYRVT
jgi:hypothetical protein